MNTKLAWCTQTPFIVNTVAQTTVRNFVTNTAVQNLGFNAFSATVNCGAYSNTWTYSGFDYQTGLPLNYATDLIKVEPASPTIVVDQPKAPGTYFVKVVGTLPDLTTTTFEIFTINIGYSGGNFAPYFTSYTFPDKSVPLKQTYTYPFPPGTDPNSGDIVTISVKAIRNLINIPIPSFITPSTASIASSNLLITPTAITDVGVFTIIVTIQDDKGASNDYKFKLTITNKAPIVTSNIPYIIVLNFGQETIKTLPTSQDPEGLSFTTKIANGPLYAAILSNTQIRFTPNNCLTDFGYQDIYIKLEDEEPRNFVYTFMTFVDNKPPKFSGMLPQN